MPYIRHGWSNLKKQFPSVIILFLYQLLWGVFLYRLVDTTIRQVLHRFPDPAPNDMSEILFVIEGQLGFWQEPNVHRILWLLGGMLLLRLLITPLIQSGILYGLLPTEERLPGLPLFRGIQQFWKPVMLFYLLELLLILLPAPWLFPKIYEMGLLLYNGVHYMPPILTTIALIIGWLIYGWFIRQTLLFLQFGYLFQHKAWPALLICWRHLLPGLQISIILAIICAVIFIVFGLMSLLWTGLIALVLHQTYPLFRGIIKIWKISSQYQLWQQKS